MNKKANVLYLPHVITSNKIKLPKTFAVDTNVLLKVYYSRSSPNDTKNKSYSRFIETIANDDKISLQTTTYNIAELFHIIERKEHEIYTKTVNPNITLKDFRNLEEQRTTIQQELELVFAQIESLFVINEVCTKVDVLKDFSENYNSIYCDNYDYSIVKYFLEHNCTNFISDDIDFSYFDGITLFTSNYAACQN